MMTSNEEKNLYNITDNKLSRFLLSGAKWNLIFTVLQKLISFTLNQSLYAYFGIGPEILGQAAIQLELLLSTLLFLSREG
jgi:oligosaccharide translocation protein RFT1